MHVIENLDNDKKIEEKKSNCPQSYGPEETALNIGIYSLLSSLVHLKFLTWDHIVYSVL